MVDGAGGREGREANGGLENKGEANGGLENKGESELEQREGERGREVAHRSYMEQ